MLWKGLQLPNRLEFERETATPTFGRFTAQPFERGFGTTIGNALRRVLLSSIEGAAVTAVKIDGVLHEFSPIQGVAEDATDIILNLKQIPLKVHTEEVKTVYLRVDRAGAVKASDIEVDHEVEILEPDAHIATISDGGHLHMELRIKRGRGYVSADKNFDEDLGIGWIPIDSVQHLLGRAGQREHEWKALGVPEREVLVSLSPRHFYGDPSLLGCQAIPKVEMAEGIPMTVLATWRHSERRLDHQSQSEI